MIKFGLVAGAADMTIKLRACLGLSVAIMSLEGCSQPFLTSRQAIAISSPVSAAILVDDDATGSDFPATELQSIALARGIDIVPAAAHPKYRLYVTSAIGPSGAASFSTEHGKQRDYVDPPLSRRYRGLSGGSVVRVSLTLVDARTGVEVWAGAGTRRAGKDGAVVARGLFGALFDRFAAVVIRQPAAG